MNTKSWTRFLLILAVAILAATCDPFGPEDSTGSRYTPVIDHLSLSRTSLLCDIAFVLTFDYTDPQDDITKIYFRMIGQDNDGLITDEIDWTSDRVDLVTRPGKAMVSCTIECDQDNPIGDYQLSIKVEDERSHVSNELTTIVSLLQ